MSLFDLTAKTDRIALVCVLLADTV